MATPAGPVPSFAPNVLVGDAPSTLSNSIMFGDYSGLAYAQNMGHPVWADGSNSTGNNPDIMARLDAYVDRVSSTSVSIAPLSAFSRRIVSSGLVRAVRAGFFGLQTGMAHPSGFHHSAAKRGWTASLDYVRPIDGRWNWDFRFGVFRFRRHEASVLSPNLRYVLNPAAPVHFFLNGGVGAYFAPGNFEGGANLGIGINKAVAPHLQLEATFDHHWAFGAFPARQFSQAQVGILFR